jgi:hypothetical protein
MFTSMFTDVESVNANAIHMSTKWSELFTSSYMLANFEERLLIFHVFFFVKKNRLGGGHSPLVGPTRMSFVLTEVVIS